MTRSLQLLMDKLSKCSLKKMRVMSNIRGYSSQPSNSDIQTTRRKLDLPQDYDPKKISKESLVWRKSWDEEAQLYFKTLRIFYSESNNVEITKRLQTPFKFSLPAIIDWFKNKQKEKEMILQSYIPERNQILGNELAAAHFIVHRGGAVKFHGVKNWIKADENGDYNLPNSFVQNMYIEAIDCTNMVLYYEGLQNFRKLKHLTWLSVNGCENIDDWCIDQICGMFYQNLVFLDLRNCPNITERGLTALWKMESLKILFLDNILRTSAYEMTILMLQEQLPDLDIKLGDFAEEE